jgi:alanyl-tRNA synthetase
MGGGGGGRKDMAQAGGKSPEGLPGALDMAIETTKKMIVS